MSDLHPMTQMPILRNSAWGFDPVGPESLNVVGTSDCVVLEDCRTGHTALFRDPIELFETSNPADVPMVLARIQAALKAGLYVAGYASYELGHVLEPKLRPLLPDDRVVPLIQMASFTAPQLGALPAQQGAARIVHFAPRWSCDDYVARFDQVKSYITAGDIYQANLTFPFDIEFEGDAFDLYCATRAAQNAPYCGFVNLGGAKVLSWSPELFFEMAGGTIASRPMKGTVKRSDDPKLDGELAVGLALDPKQKAENLMIVDLIRNDISRMAQIGSVTVPELFKVETYPTFHTMTSRVEGAVLPDITMLDLFTALFPCGSVTGAPKIRAMQVIDELETAPRGAYCGGMGYFAPDGRACFNVTIRTLTTFEGGRGVYSTGSGVVHDSDGIAEYDECLLKSKFLLGDPV